MGIELRSLWLWVIYSTLTPERLLVEPKSCLNRLYIVEPHSSFAVFEKSDVSCWVSLGEVTIYDFASGQSQSLGQTSVKTLVNFGQNFGKTSYFRLKLTKADQSLYR